jgi:16S rRNA (cytosine967-C5)-methyltransferase
MISPARVAAFEILRAISSGRADLPSAIAHIRTRVEDERDRALAAEIATGVQRWRATIDHLIGTFSKRPFTRLDGDIVDILRLGAYQLLHLSRVPASAVVDDAVDLARRAGKRSAAGFVNAVLREVSRRRRALPIPARPANPRDRVAAVDYLTIALSHPRWLAERWYDRFGFEIAEAWLRFNNSAAPLTLRANPLKTSIDDLIETLRADDIAVSRGRFAPGALIVERGHPLRGRGLAGGLFVVQDEASQLVALLAGSPGRRALDTCASPGGKTTALAAAMHNEGQLLACDVRDRRIELLRRTVAASGATNIRLVQADLLQPLPLSVQFDCVLVDAPCSGLGTLRRDPDIRWRRREEDLTTLAAAQKTMIANAADCVAPGGRLIYATCSSEPEENEYVVDAFLASHPSFVPVDARSLGALPAAVIDARGYLRTAPHLHALEAFFGAVMAATATPRSPRASL